MGGRHAHDLAQRVGAAEVVAIMDLDKVRADEVAAACGGAAVFTNAPALIRDHVVEAIVIASPDPTHADLAIACIEAGKPVLCEKPLGVDIEDAKRVLDGEVAGGRRLIQVGLMRMYDPQHAALRQAIDDDRIGRPLLFRGIHKHWWQERAAVDVIVKSAVHNIHSARLSPRRGRLTRPGTALAARARARVQGAGPLRAREGVVRRGRPSGNSF